MTRKDYQLIAAVLNKFTAEGGVVTERDAMAYDLADALALDNPRFDRSRFLVAAGVWEASGMETRKANFQRAMESLNN